MTPNSFFHKKTRDDSEREGISSTVSISPLSVLAGLFVQIKTSADPFCTKRAAREKRGGNKRCGVMPGRTELNPRLLPTHLPSQLLFVGNSEPMWVDAASKRASPSLSLAHPLAPMPLRHLALFVRRNKGRAPGLKRGVQFIFDTRNVSRYSLCNDKKFQA